MSRREKHEASSSCCLCGNAIKSAQCPHPWNLPFAKWPQNLLAQVQTAAPNPWAGG